MTPAVALFVYNRPELLRGTLDCLRNAGFRRLEVFADGARTEADAARVEEVRSVVAHVDWADVNLVARDRNLGLSESIRTGLDAAFERHDALVVMEDDVWVAPEFGSYVTAALAAYAEEERVAGVTGTRMPFARRAVAAYPYDAFMLPRFFPLAWATWRRAWQTFELDHGRLLDRLRAESPRLDVAGVDLPYMTRNVLIRRSLHGAWDVCAAASVVLNDQYFLVPAWNMVENPGISSGTHPNRPRWRLRWETELRREPPYRFPPVELEPRIHRSWLVFKENPRGWTLRRLVPRPARMLLRRIRGTYELFPRE